MKKLLLALALLTVIAMNPAVAAAVDYGGIGGRPANPQTDNPRSTSIFIYTLKPGDTHRDGVEVFNNTGSEKTITIGEVDSALTSDGAFTCAQEAANKIDVGSWITLSSDTVTVPSGTSRVVDFTITVPTDAGVGEHDGCITMQDASKTDSSSKSGVIVSFRSAIRVAITIPGKIVKSVSVTKIDLKQNSTDAAKYTIQPYLYNAGNVSVDTTLTTKLISFLGTTVESQDATYPILPSSTATWNFDFTHPFWGGIYRADTTITYNSNVADGIGAKNGTKITTDNKSSRYVVIPPTFLAGAVELIIVLVLIASIFLLIRKLRHRHTVARHWHSYSVVHGDSLHGIAKHHHISWKRLATANKLKAPYHLEPGQKIKIPPTTNKG
jgi:nucleoid-associated protein YgaU